jgi:hypothetical protein
MIIFRYTILIFPPPLPSVPPQQYVNHTYSDMTPDEKSPFGKDSHMMP